MARTGNVLSVLATGGALHADGVTVRYGRPGQALDSVTPAVRPINDAVELPVLGLWPETAYELRVIAHGEGGTGRYIARPTTADTSDIEPLVEFDPLGNQVQRLGCARGLRPRFHDVLVEPDGSYWLMCDETRVMDLSGANGVPAAAVTGTVVQHLDPSGGLMFEWSAFDHFDITDLDEDERSGQRSTGPTETRWIWTPTATSSSRSGA